MVGSPLSLRICICVCICICVIVFLYLCLHICACIFTVLCSCMGISVQTNITALVRWIAFLETWLCICHRFVDMYFSQTDSVFLSQILHISMWHHSGAGGPIRIFERAKSIRIKFPKPWARCPTMEIIRCSARPNLMPQNGSRRPLQILKTDEHPPNEDLFFGRLLGNSFEDDHNHQHNNQSYHHQHILNIQGEESKQLRCRCDPLHPLQRVTTDGHPPNERLLSEVFWQILSKLTIIIITIIIIIINHMHHTYWRRYISTCLAGLTQSGLSRGSQRPSSSQRGTPFGRIWGKFFWRWPL